MPLFVSLLVGLLVVNRLEGVNLAILVHADALVVRAEHWVGKVDFIDFYNLTGNVMLY